MNQTPHIRWMIRRDLNAVLDIESQSFSVPWDEEEFIYFLRERNVIGQVAVFGEEEVVGFIVYELFRERLEILNIAVHPEHRRRGIGTAIVEHLYRKLSPQRRDQIVLETSEANVDAHLFFRARGFTATGVVRGDDSDMDAYRFVRRYEPMAAGVAS